MSPNDAHVYSCCIAQNRWRRLWSEWQPGIQACRQLSSLRMLPARSEQCCSNLSWTFADDGCGNDGEESTVLLFFLSDQWRPFMSTDELLLSIDLLKCTLAVTATPLEPRPRFPALSFTKTRLCFWCARFSKTSLRWERESGNERERELEWVRKRKREWEKEEMVLKRFPHKRSFEERKTFPPT